MHCRGTHTGRRGSTAAARLTGSNSCDLIIIVFVLLVNRYITTCVGQTQNETTAFNREITSPLIDIIYSNGALGEDWDANIVESSEDLTVPPALPSLLSTTFEVQNSNLGEDGEVVLFAYLNENDALKLNTTESFGGDYNITIA